jgi:hypothetical protein
MDASPVFINAMGVRKFISEGPAHYGQYRFGYCLWLELEDREALDQAYPAGFLPFSAEPGDPRHLFYMARSLRIALPDFAADKKRRYDHRTWQAFGLQRTLLPKAEFLRKYGPQALTTALTWMQNRFGEAYLKPERLHYILDKPFLTNVLTWTRKDHLAAYALIVRGDWGAHYWYVFYENDPGMTTAPGHGYLVDFLDWAQSESLPHAYIGTGYGTKSRYKTRGLTGVEWWNGNEWNRDKDRLVRSQEADDAQG